MSKSRRSPSRARVREKPGRIAPFLANVSLAAWLLALAVIPAYFNIQSSANFEPDKAALMRWLALAAAGPWLMARMREKKRISRPRGLPGLLLLLAATAAVSTLTGVDAVTGFWGNADRGYGLLSIWAGLGLTWAAYELTRRGLGWRLVDAALFGSVIPAFYGLIQVLGFDPVRGSATSFVLGQRAAGSLGNPLFLGDFLLLAIILAAARGFAGPRLRGWSRWAWLALMLVFVMALAATGSRSALFGALAALATLFFAWGRLSGRRNMQLLAWLTIATGGGLLLVAWFAPQWLPSRLGDLFASGGTGGQRLLFWQAVIDLFRREPRWLFLGLGPDALAFRLAPHLPAAIAHYEPDWAFRIPDRAHTLLLDGIAVWGVLGQVVWTAFYAAVMARVLPQWRIGRMSLSWLAPMLGAWILALAVALLAGWAMAALGYAAGLLLGAWLVLLLAPNHRSTTGKSGQSTNALGPFLLAALAGHWLLLAFSFSTHAADLLLALILGLAWAGPDLAAKKEASQDARRMEPKLGLGLASPRVAAAAAAAFAFSLSAAGISALPLWLAAVAFLLLLSLAYAFAPSRMVSSSASFVLTFVLPILLLLPAIWLNRFPGLSAWLAYAWFWLWLWAQLFALARAFSPPSSLPRPSARVAVFSLSLLALSSLAFALPVFGDIAYKSAILSPWNAAARERYMKRAFFLSPHDHILAAGVVPTEELTLPADASLAHPQAQRIMALYERAINVQPLAPEPPAAYAEWLRGRTAVDPTAADKARAMYERALALSPNNIQTRNGLALLKAATGDPDGAIVDLQALLILDPLYGPTYLNLAQLQWLQGDVDAARATLKRGAERVFWWPDLQKALAETLSP
ncbi:MAG: hypothetical protein GXP42_19055 [Chloroflexi bacterium]|nr:hypothetical protein [Chloroflexota bacterium]